MKHCLCTVILTVFNDFATIESLHLCCGINPLLLFGWLCVDVNGRDLSISNGCKSVQHTCQDEGILRIFLGYVKSSTLQYSIDFSGAKLRPQM